MIKVKKVVEKNKLNESKADCCREIKKEWFEITIKPAYSNYFWQPEVLVLCKKHLKLLRDKINKELDK